MPSRALALVALLCALPALASKDKDLSKWPTRPFSADMVMTSKKDGAKPVRQRVYFSQGRMRLEMDMGGQTRTMINDLGKSKSFMLMPDQKMAMDLSASMTRARSQGLTPDSLASSSGDLCAAATAAGHTCKKLGSERVQGRAATKWQLTDKSGQVSTVWLDDALQVMLRQESATGSVEMQNLKEGPQPDSLFQVPADYKRMQAPAGMPGGPGTHKP